MFRDIAAHNVGTISSVGLYTFVDPRLQGGKVNDVTKEDIVKLIDVDGKEQLLYKSQQIQIAFLRASYADEFATAPCTAKSLLLTSRP